MTRDKLLAQRAQRVQNHMGQLAGFTSYF